MTDGRSLAIFSVFHCVFLLDVIGGVMVSIQNESGSDMRFVSIGLVGKGDDRPTPYCLGSFEAGQRSSWFVFTEPNVEFLASVVFLTENRAIRVTPPQAETTGFPDGWSFLPVETAAYTLTIRSDYTMEVDRDTNPQLQEMTFDTAVMGVMLAFSDSTDIEFGFRNERTSDDLDVLKLLENQLDLPTLAGKKGLSVAEGLISMAIFRVGWFSALVESGYELEPEGAVDIDRVLYEVTSDYSILSKVRELAQAAFTKGRSDAANLLSSPEGLKLQTDE